MIASRRPRHAVRHWRTLLASLALATAGTHMQAQEQTARLVKDANTTKQNLPAGIQWIAPVGQGTNVVFPKDSLASGKELWVSDGTAKGTKLLKDIAPGAGGSYPQQGVPFGTGAGAKVAFLTHKPSYIYDADAPPEFDLWVTDGTAAGTVRVLESPFPQDRGDTYLCAGTTNGAFLEDSSWAKGRELFFSDGTPGGTHSLNPVVNNQARKFSNPGNYTTSGSWCYFSANGNEMWRSDGTDAGTTKLATFTGLSPNGGVVVGENLFVNVTVQAAVSSALWMCPAAGGTPSRVAPPSGTTWRYIMYMNSAGDDSLVFVTQDQAGKSALWATDGTEAGTHRIPLTLPGQTVESQVAYSLTQWQDAVYFSTTHSGVASGVWRTDGTTAGTTLLKTIKSPYGAFNSMWAGADGVYYLTSTDSGYQLSRTQGTAATTVAMKGTPYIRYVAGMQFPPIITPTASTVYFLSGQETPAEFLVRTKNAKGGKLQLTRSDTINGTGIPPHPVGAPPYEMLASGLLEFVSAGIGQELWQIDLKGKSRSLFRLSLPGRLGFHGVTPSGALFSRYVPGSPAEVYVTDGKARSTISLIDAPSAVAFDIVKAGNLWFCSPAYLGNATASAVLKTDGTEAGSAVLEATDGTKPNRFGNMVPFQGSIWFIAVSTDGNKRSLWRSDGTTAGTVRVANTWYGDASETVRNLSVAGGKLYFSVVHSGKEYLWQSDGTTAGTVEVSAATTFASLSSSIVDLGGVPIFQAQVTGGLFTQWWAVSNGGLSTITSPPIGSAASSETDYPRYAVAGTQLFFDGNSTGGMELWVTNGTTAGTHQVKDINPGETGSDPSNMIAVGNHVYFIASDETHGRELWRSDGTEAGTVLVADVEPGPQSSLPQGLKVIGSKLYFHAESRTTGRELYTIDLPQQ
jgi:ELWxxDGT repeat protein